MGPEQQPVPGGLMGKIGKVPLIIGGVVVVGVVGWLITGGMSRAVTGVDTDQHLDGSTTYTDSEGNSATVGGNSYPESWPSDAPRYSNASIQYSGSSNPQTGEAGAAVVFSTSDTVAEVVAFYKQELAAKGWIIEQTAVAGGATIMAARKDTRSLGLQIVLSGGQTMVTMGISLQ